METSRNMDLAQIMEISLATTTEEDGGEDLMGIITMEFLKLLNLEYFFLTKLEKK